MKPKTAVEQTPKDPQPKDLQPRDTHAVKGGLEYKLDRCFVKSWSTSGDAD